MGGREWEATGRYRMMLEWGDVMYVGTKQPVRDAAVNLKYSSPGSRPNAARRIGGRKHGDLGEFQHALLR